MSKKRIIAIITIIVLLFAAGISVGVFLYGRAETQAADGSQTSDPNQDATGNQDNQGSLIEGNNQNIENEVTNPEDGEENTTTPNEGNANEVENNETVENDNQNANNEATNNNNNVANNENDGNNEGVTTNNNVENVGETTITRVEEQERLISEDFLDWWQPMTVSVKPTEVGVELPQISVKKSAITGVGEDKLIYIGQNITYVIAVTNNSEIPVEDIEITDRIPENTTYVENSIEDAVILRKVDEELTSEVVGTKTTIESDNKVVGVKWVVSIPAGETVFARFTVNVNKTMENENQEEVETTGTILNTAIANGEESNEVQTSIIRTHKSSEITRLNEETQQYEVVETAKIGDLIKYTISVENTGDVEGTTYVIDEVPKGTAFVSAQDGARVTKSVNTSIIWSVIIPAHTTITREFTVEVTSVDGIIKNIANVGGTPTNEDIIDTANIDVIKTATAVKRAGEDEFTTPVGEVRENDVIQYTIVVTNTGSRDLTKVLLEEQLECVEVTKLVVDNIEKTIEKDVETGKLIIGDLKAAKEATEETEAVEAGVAVITAEYKVTYDKDIKGKGNEDGTIIPIYNKVIATGETIPNPENPQEVPEKVEDNDDETVPVAEDPRFEVVKTAIQVGKVGEDGTITFSDITGKVTPGDIVKYEIVVTNTGNTKLTNIEVRDTLNVRVDECNLNEEPIIAGNIIKVIPSLVAGAHETIITYYEVNQNDMELGKFSENDEIEIEIIKNIVTAKPEELEEKQDDEIVPVNPYISRKVTKTWLGDEDNKYATRPADITVRLYDDGEEVDVVIITANQEGNWEHEFPKLPKYNEDGTVVVYTVTEDDVPYYAEKVPTTDMQEYTITNTLDQEKISVPITKTWDDNNNKYNTRPSQIIVRLYADGNEVQVADKITAESVDQDGKWNYEFTNLPKYNGLGNEIVYTIAEDDIADYEEVVEGFNITNRLNPEEATSISGTKTWVDNDNAYNTRPDKIAVNLMIDNSIVKTQDVTPDASGNWKYSFTNLPTKDVNGKTITYSIKESPVPKYSEGKIEVTQNPNIINIENTIAQEIIDVKGTKTWIAPASAELPTVTVNLYRDDVEILVDTTTIVNDNDNRTGQYIFTGLAKYDLTTGREYVYTVKEVVPDGYEKVADDGRNFTNKINQEYITISGSKTWRIPDEMDKANLPDVTIMLYKNGEPVLDEKGKNVVATIKKGDNYYEFGGLPKYKVDENGNYRIKDDGEFEENEYKVIEVPVEGYVSSPANGYTTSENLETDEYNFINTIEQEKISISGTKYWDDANNQDGLRDDITIRLYADGKELTNVRPQISKARDKEGIWTYTFSGLDKYNDQGKIIKYTVTEDQVSGYEKPIINGYNITNKHTPETITVKATKTWNDNDDEHKDRPSSIEIQLYKTVNGSKTSMGDNYKVTLTPAGENGTWLNTESKEWPGLPKYEGGNLITYSVEEKAITNYKATYTPTTDNKGNVTVNIKNTWRQDITGTITTIEETEVPLDVVFVLDISSSMLDKDGGNKTRAQYMVEAANSSIKELMKSPNNRIAVVLFNSNVYQLTDKDKLKHYNADSNGNYITYSEEGSTDKAGAYISFAGKSTKVTVPTNNDWYACGTYTQGGIKTATSIFKNSSNGTTVKNSKGENVTRKPVMILLTDGDPTHYETETDYNKYGDTKYPTWKIAKLRYITPEYYAYTMKTMEKSKTTIKNHYNKACELYTVGINMQGTMAKALLEPSSANINHLSDTKNSEVSPDIHNHDDNGNQHKDYSHVDADGVWRKNEAYYKYQATELEGLLTNSNSTTKVTPGYVNKAYTNSTSGDIANNFADIVRKITEVKTVITDELYGSDRRIELNGFNPNSEYNQQSNAKNVYSLKIKSDIVNVDTENINDANSKKYIKQDPNTKKYYLVLTDVLGCVEVELTYHK